MEKYCWNKVRQNDKTGQPNLRWGHSCCIIEDEVVFFGGYADSSYMNDLWSFNTITMEWTEIMTHGDVPSLRSNCSMSYDCQNEQLVLFGGGGANKKRFNSVNLLNWKTKQWIEINPKQNQSAPWQRTYHTAQLFYPYLVVFGGEGVSDLDDLWVFDFNSLSWTQVPIGKEVRPAARRFHSSARVGNQFFVIAGCHSKYRCLNDVYSIDLTRLVETGKVDQLKWKLNKMEGSAFLSRWGHSSAVYEGKIYVFGGRFSSDLNDILVIDSKKGQISTLKISNPQNEIPNARRRHSACFLGSNMLIFGGFNGEYFNDLYYINVYPQKKKNSLPNSFASLRQQQLESLPESMSQLESQQGTLITIYKGLLKPRFPSLEQLDYFLQDINKKCKEEQLRQLIQILYDGYGLVEEDIIQKYSIKVCCSKEQKQEEARDKIVNGEERQVLVIGKKAKPFEPVVMLEDEAFQQHIQSQRQYNYFDMILNINDQVLQGVNVCQLALRSSYFSFLLSRKYSQTRNPTIQFKTKNALAFSMLISYLSSGLLAVPQSADINLWIDLLHLSQFYCVQTLKAICENQLVSRIDDDCCQKLLMVAFDLNLPILKSSCGEYIIKIMVNREDDYSIIFKEAESQRQAFEKEKMLKNIYRILRFDILQKKIQKEEHLAQIHLKKVQSQQLHEAQQQEKENYENNM